MVEVAERKLFLGGRVKRLRRELGLTQSRMAEDLGLSASYLNLIERDQRPLTAQVLLRLARTYDIDVRSLSEGSDAGGAQSLAEVLADPMFRDLALARHEIDEAARNAPGVAEALVRLYRAHLASPAGEAPDDAARVNPLEWASAFMEAQRRHFPELDEAGEVLAAELADDPPALAVRAAERLRQRHGVRVQIVPAEVIEGYARRYDHHRRRLMICERLAPASRSFALACQLGLLEHRDLLSTIAERAGPAEAAARRLLRVALANYLAAATLMPYEPFRDACEASGYDIDLLAARFEVSVEQACQRLTTLSRPSARGAPIFMVRVDRAGWVSKRLASGAFPFSRFGGLCPRWGVHEAFAQPGRLIREIIETPEGARFFTVSRTVPRVGGGDELAIAIGCEMKFAPRLGVATRLDLAPPRHTLVGPACRLCPRRACPSRAAPPNHAALMVEDFAQPATPFAFVPADPIAG